jgi:hypothetical protein
LKRQLQRIATITNTLLPYITSKKRRIATITNTLLPYITSKKTSIPLKMYLKSLAILEKASIFLEKSSKIIEISMKEMSSKSLGIFIKASDF